MIFSSALSTVISYVLPGILGLEFLDHPSSLKSGTPYFDASNWCLLFVLLHNCFLKTFLIIHYRAKRERKLIKSSAVGLRLLFFKGVKKLPLAFQLRTIFSSAAPRRGFE